MGYRVFMLNYQVILVTVKVLYTVDIYYTLFSLNGTIQEHFFNN